MADHARLDFERNCKYLPLSAKCLQSFCTRSNDQQKRLCQMAQPFLNMMSFRLGEVTESFVGFCHTMRIFTLLNGIARFVITVD